MDQLTQSAPKIIEQAARSTLGILALMILALSALGFFFFRRSPEWIRAVIYVLLFVGVVSFSVATIRSVKGPPAPEPEPTLHTDTAISPGPAPHRP